MTAMRADSFTGVAGARAAAPATATMTQPAVAAPPFSRVYTPI